MKPARTEEWLIGAGGVGGEWREAYAVIRCQPGQRGAEKRKKHYEVRVGNVVMLAPTRQSALRMVGEGDALL